MILFKKAKAISKYLRKKGGSVGFVPTMGALHEGHISLIKQASGLCDVVVCSIFVNPTQFNDKADFDKYPVTTQNDLLLLEHNKTNVVFLPGVNEIYADGTDKLMHFELGNLENILEGFYRPGHFQGVCNVVNRLLDIIKPDKLFLGQKDYQQVMVIKKMMQAYHPQVMVSVVPTEREPDGLAMSSRNMRLSERAKQQAAVLYKALQFIKQNIETNFGQLKQQASAMIVNSGFDTIDYIEICYAETLQPADAFHQPKKLIALVAAYIENVRLIDNLILD